MESPILASMLCPSHLRAFAPLAMVVGVVALLSSCAPLPRFHPGPWISPSPDSLAAIDTLAVAGRVLVTVGDVRYRARWALAACVDALRLQVFQSDGAFIADIGLRGDSMTVLFPQTMECHMGQTGMVPIDSLMQFPAPWEAGMRAFHAMVWPHRLPAPWIPGTLGDRRGWYSEPAGTFIEPDHVARLPRFLSLIDGDVRLMIEVREWSATPAGMVPAEVRLAWPAHQTEMWLDLAVRKTEGFGGEVLDVECPPGADVRSW